MKLTKMHYLGIALGVIVIILSLIFFLNKEDQNLFYFLIGIAVTIIALPFVIGVVVENERDQQISEMFLEFARNLSESVNSGTPISKSIINVGKNNYGDLTPYTQKLANQISLGIPVETALRNFAYDVDNAVITRAIALISEAERAGGDIEHILESVAKSIAEVEKLKKERKAAVYNLIVQGYIIFFIFIGIMLVMEFKILPLTSGIGSVGFFNSGGSIDSVLTDSAQQVSEFDPEILSTSFLYLLIAQGVFAGLTIGKLTEGSVKAGIKHSFILAIASILISTGARVLLK